MLGNQIADSFILTVVFWLLNLILNFNQFVQNIYHFHIYCGISNTWHWECITIEMIGSDKAFSARRGETGSVIKKLHTWHLGLRHFWLTVSDILGSLEDVSRNLRLRGCLRGSLNRSWMEVSDLRMSKSWRNTLGNLSGYTGIIQNQRNTRISDFSLSSKGLSRYRTEAFRMPFLIME